MLTFFAIMPIALAYLAGWTAKATGLLRTEHWVGIELLSFRILIPAILIKFIATADLSSGGFGYFAFALVLLVIIGAVLALGTRAIMPKEALSAASLSTVFQTTTRWNAFIALSAAELLGGSELLVLIALGMTVLIPFINVLNILVIVSLCGGETGPRRIFKALAINPLIIGSVIGLALNFAPFDVPSTVFEALDIIGRAALGIGLLVVGAGISLDRLRRFNAAVAYGAIYRPVAMPLVFMALATVFGLSPLETLAGVLVASVPAATNGYVVARAMGGDAELYADILIYQTFVSMITIPIYAAFIL